MNKIINRKKLNQLKLLYRHNLISQEKLMKILQIKTLKDLDNILRGYEWKHIDEA